jgi:hypothetical protein
VKRRAPGQGRVQKNEWAEGNHVDSSFHRRNRQLDFTKLGVIAGLDRTSTAILEGEDGMA